MTMATDVSDRVREIPRYRGIDEAAIIQRAVEVGVETLWRDVVISKYLNGDITREQARDEPRANDQPRRSGGISSR